jgi:hypothetical protein
MADEEVKPVEETTTETTESTEPTQEELPLAAAAEEKPEADAAADTEGDKPAEPVKAEEKPAEDWRDKELKAKYRRQKELERVLAEKEAEIAARDALLAKFNQGKTDEPKLVPADEIERRANELNEQKQYVENCNKTASEGEKTYGEHWKEAVSNLELLGGFDQKTMNGVLATDAPAKVLYELGKNPDRYYQLMQMPLERRIIEMGKIAMAPNTKPVSNAPAPVNPVGGRAAPAKETINDNMDDDKWYAVRLAQKRAKWKAGQISR